MKLKLVVLCIVGLIGVPVTSAEASCSNFPGDGYMLPGIVLRVQHTGSGECFTVWLNDDSEILSYLEKSPADKLYIEVSGVSGSDFQAHNPAYSWYADVAFFTAGLDVDDVKPSDLSPDGTNVSYMAMLITDAVDNRIRDWVNLGIVNNKVDVSEITLVVTAWDADYKKHLDIYPDGEINVLDVLQMVQRWNDTSGGYAQVGQYVPTNCGVWDATLISVQFENHDGQNLTFWTDIEQDGSWWRRPVYVSSDDGFGVILNPTGYGDVTEVRLLASKLTNPIITNIQWSSSCDYAPPVGIKYDGEPDPFTGAAKAEAISAGTWFTAVDEASAPTILTQAGLDELGITEAEYESVTGEELELVPAYSPGQISDPGLAEFLLYYGNGNFDHVEYQVSDITVHEWKMHAYMYQIHLPFENHEIRVRGRVFEMDGAFTTDLWSADQFTFGTYVSISKGQFAVFNRRYCGLWTHFVDGRNVTLAAGGSNIECFFLP